MATFRSYVTLPESSRFLDGGNNPWNETSICVDLSVIFGLRGQLRVNQMGKPNQKSDRGTVYQAIFTNPVGKPDKHKLIIGTVYSDPQKDKHIFPGCWLVASMLFPRKNFQVSNFSIFFLGCHP